MRKFLRETISEAGKKGVPAHHHQTRIETLQNTEKVHFTNPHPLPHTHRPNLNVAHSSRVQDHVWNAEKVTTTDSREISRVEESLTKPKLLNGEVDVVAIGELIEAGRNAAALLYPVAVQQK